MPEPEPIYLEPDPVIEAYKKDVDRTLIQENLKLTLEQRIIKMVAVRDFVLEMRGAAAGYRQDRVREPDSASR